MYQGVVGGPVPRWPEQVAMYKALHPTSASKTDADESVLKNTGVQPICEAPPVLWHRWMGREDQPDVDGVSPGCTCTQCHKKRRQGILNFNN